MHPLLLILQYRGYLEREIQGCSHTYSFMELLHLKLLLDLDTHMSRLTRVLFSATRHAIHNVDNPRSVSWMNNTNKKTRITDILTWTLNRAEGHKASCCFLRLKEKQRKQGEQINSHQVHGYRQRCHRALP